MLGCFNLSNPFIILLMKNFIFDVKDLRMEISFKTYAELRSLLSFYRENNINKINIPCKNSIKKDFLLNAIKISRIEFPDIDIVPHFSILHEFRRNKINTINSFIYFLETVKYLGCKKVLLVSGSQKRVTLDCVKTLSLVKDNILFSNNVLSIGVAFNPYLPNHLFEDEIIKLEEKLQSGLVKSIWIQFGTNSKILESRLKILKQLFSTLVKDSSEISNIILFGSILIPSKQFLARFKYRPWKGVYCSKEFLDSEEFAIDFVINLFKIYKKYKILPLIETNTCTQNQLERIKILLENIT